VVEPGGARHGSRSEHGRSAPGCGAAQRGRVRPVFRASRRTRLNIGAPWQAHRIVDLRGRTRPCCAAPQRRCV